MLSYLHSFHAGSRDDVHKHRALAALLIAMTAKPRPISYMETHAGRGLYDLAGPEAAKTGEAKDGIERVLAEGAVPDGDPYLGAVAAARAKHGRTAYPGSPWIAQHLLRDDDQIHLMERHPAEAPALRRLMQGSGAHIHERDGLEGVLALSPPTPRRGVVLIDPSYEVKAEYDAIAAFIPALHKKWPEAVILLWYPLLADARHETMIAKLTRAALPRLDRDERVFPDRGQGLRGSGLLIANAPFGFKLADLA